MAKETHHCRCEIAEFYSIAMLPESLVGERSIGAIKGFLEGTSDPITASTTETNRLVQT
ncbi:hypothetical protein [Mesorhizobium sp.]|uniref:hypothetical protein n=1 Tax=Mesorhizobium sp. TaxID=1871066 RepID=UPI0025E91B95|nr:hypothetical protein [Mesorhizobium sp.]